MAGRKGQVSIQESVETDEEFDKYLEEHYEQVICMEVYSEFCGPCQATQNAIRKGKMEIGQDFIAMVKAQSDNISYLERFRYKSQPCFLFINKKKITDIVFGANGIELCRVCEESIKNRKIEDEGGPEMKKYALDELTPIEIEKIEIDSKLEAEIKEQRDRLRVLTHAARKKRVCERMAVPLRRYNYIMFWPHCHKAHYDLYEKWDSFNISVAGKEELQIKEEDLPEVLYMSDVEPNEACLHALMNGNALIVLFKMLDSDDRDFVKLVRKALYEDIPEPKEDLPPEKQLPPIPAFERYASISKTAREVRRDRYNAKMEKLRQEREDRERLKREQERLAREAEEERLREEKQREEDAKMARLAAGLTAEPEPEPVEVGEEGLMGEGLEGEEGEKAMTETTDATEAVTEEPGADEAQPEDLEHVEVEEEFHSDVEVEGEDYIPPGGLFVPGLYAPPNDLARANGLAFFFPKQVSNVTKIESAELPPHILVIFPISQRHEILEVIQQFKEEILNYGIFTGDDPFTAEHVAYTMKQYEKMSRIRRHLDRVAVAVSRKRSLPMLQLAGFNPIYISSDAEAGERDCLTLFPVGYGDGHEDVESVEEEEVAVASVKSAKSAHHREGDEYVEEEESEDED